MKQSFIKLVYAELKNIINMKSSKQQQKKETQLIDYFKIVESNILYTFQKIKKEYERD
ncbi:MULTISPECIES: hypothetical protein [Rickettsia]|uniref:Uncharacterized protein n=7 Tax=spotted fever group TaxID=114277 RepID=A0A8E0WLC0_9RICK|nr:MULTISPECIES: hypothetical protein [Rickettsia]AAY61609.1 unknown [Rickettsia felis URRWXCal2]AFC69785.1 hypothetical protein MCE_04430 [Rickettsia amblyommatis str. GAT-30V]MCC8406972.1 hypothetical protein [Rickettsia endosymbiont of Sceptobius lativentris]MCC8461740.1 hypothetical protein [Rickettsia endosymbiont of Ecitomorpha arachnoides]MDE8611365.1 hypothetical protein [Rickettsia felis]CDI30005.1 hypothetical protein RMONA_6840 [Rickettsia monacensis IrR/Munich]